MTTANWGIFNWNYCAICGGTLTEADDGQSLRPYCATCHRFYYSNPIPAACCFLQNDANELLLVQRAVEPRKGMWTLPGGFIELGETAEQAVLRELQEETGLVGRNPRLIGVATRPSRRSGGVLLLGYRVDDWEGEMQPDTDASDLGFFHRDARPEIAFEGHQHLIDIYDTIIHGPRG